jgi:predicted CXXCH cytochrome family protein
MSTLLLQEDHAMSAISWESDKGVAMKLNARIYLGIFLLIAFASVVSAASEQEKFKLKSGAKGKVCLTCHVDFQNKLKNLYIHTPVKSGDCTGCHNPHAASHGKLLEADPNKICFKCHSSVLPRNAVSSHKVAVEGNCVKCHDPHASNNKFVLLQAGNDLCFSCHKQMGEVITKVKFKHGPVQRGCTGCHNPHASSTAAFLLKDEPKTLCLQCHKTDKASFSAQHSGYPVARGRCTTCHDPHGSDRSGILYSNVHKPVANKQCNQCHEAQNSPNPFATKKTGYELCKGCHSAMVNETFSKNRIHWPVASKQGCSSCHNPHASPEKGLLKAPMLSLCSNCHADTIARQQKSQTKHPPISEGTCTACHSPHSSDSAFILNQPAIVDLCGTCHDWQKHSTHPIGEKVRDPRNKNLSVQCLSCHRSHGTEHKNMIYYAQIGEMCTQCHAQYKR